MMTEHEITKMGGWSMGSFYVGLKHDISGKKSVFEISYPDALRLFKGLKEHFEIIETDPEKEIAQLEE